MADIRDRVADWLFWDRHDWLWIPARHLPLRWRLSPYGAVMTILCLVKGHEPCCSRCDRPEWDECRWCEKVLPGRAHPSGGPCPGWVPRHEAVDRGSRNGR